MTNAIVSVWVGGAFDPAAFDPDEVNEVLARLAWRPLSASSQDRYDGWRWPGRAAAPAAVARAESSRPLTAVAPGE